MTREEAIARIKDHVEHHGIGEYPHIKLAEALDIALSALYPVSREQVEKVWRGEWVHKRSPYDYKIFVCKKCGKQISIQGENMNFCPACGAAQTDEAMQIVMGRLEELYEKTD